jgi:hypothetical protein
MVECGQPLRHALGDSLDDILPTVLVDVIHRLAQPPLVFFDTRHGGQRKLLAYNVDDMTVSTIADVPGRFRPQRTLDPLVGGAVLLPPLLVAHESERKCTAALLVGTKGLAADASGHEQKLGVYDLNTGRWRRLPVLTPERLRWSRSMSQWCMNPGTAVAYWIERKGTSTWVVLEYDLRINATRELELPDWAGTRRLARWALARTDNGVLHSLLYYPQPGRLGCTLVSLDPAGPDATQRWTETATPPRANTRPTALAALQGTIVLFYGGGAERYDLTKSRWRDCHMPAPLSAPLSGETWVRAATIADSVIAFRSKTYGQDHACCYDIRSGVWTTPPALAKLPRLGGFDTACYGISGL